MRFTERGTPPSIERKREKLQREGEWSIIVFQGVQTVGTILCLSGLGGVAAKDFLGEEVVVRGKEAFGVGLMLLFANMGYAAVSGIRSYRKAIELEEERIRMEKAKATLKAPDYLKPSA